ncbi:indole-3-glycerol phosphate synthase [Streptomyces niveus]|uniref:indole-3-glycerol phosphate synthase n=1 Tax=Streptomyces niveus TaxID=193462 RepID=UPI003448CE23
MFTSVLMIEKPLSSVDVEFVTTLHGTEEVAFILLMQPRGDQADALLRAIDDVAFGELKEAGREGDEPEGAEARGPAELALTHSLAALRAAGREATGVVVENHPLDHLKSVVEESAADEVIVLTEPHYVEEFFHRDWASRARHKVGVPVLKLFAHGVEDDEAAGDGGGAAKGAGGSE